MAVQFSRKDIEREFYKISREDARREMERRNRASQNVGPFKKMTESFWSDVGGVTGGISGGAWGGAVLVTVGIFASVATPFLLVLSFIGVFSGGALGAKFGRRRKTFAENKWGLASILCGLFR